MRATMGLVAVLAAVAAGCGGGSSSTPPPSSGTLDGRQIFTTVGCSSCHRLADAKATGQIGPDLDKVEPTMAQVVKQVTDGGGAMPPFRNTLSATQIQAVAAYVARVAGR